MARKIWTQAEVDELAARIRLKVEREEPLTCGEDTIWGRLKHEGRLTPKYVSEVDFLMSVDF